MSIRSPAVAVPPAAPAPRLTVRYPTRRALLTASRAEGQHVSIFAPTPECHAPGTLLDVSFHFGDCEQAFRLLGRVAFQRRYDRGPGQEVGLGLNFEGESKWPAAQMVAFCAGRPASLGTAVRPRVDTSIRCTVRVGAQQLSGQVLDLSASGLFVATEVLGRLRPGQDVHIRLDPGWFSWGGKPVEARVVWRGEKRGTRGFGARFLGDTAHSQAALRRYLPTK